MKTRRLSMTSDLVFRTVLGRDNPECKKALIAMLNLILDRKEDPIIDLEYKNPFHLNEYMIGKQTAMDIKVLTTLGEIINVEMQVENLDYYVNRSILYTGQIADESLESGEDYDKIKRVVHISIVSGNLKEGSDKYHGIYRYLEVGDKTELSDVVELHYLKLNRLPDKPLDEMEPLEQFGAYLASVGRDNRDEKIETLVSLGEEAIVLTDTILRKASQEEILREKERARKRWEMDQRVKKRAWDRMVEEAKEEVEKAKEEAEEAKEETKAAKEETKIAKKETKEAKEQAREADRRTQKMLELTGKMVKDGLTEEILRLSEEPAFLKEMLQRYGLE